MPPLPPTSRRNFLRNAALTAASCQVLAGELLAAQDPEILGQGSHRYRVVPGWGVLDNRTPVNDCHAMVQDKRGRLLLLTNESRNNVIIYDRTGKLLGTWGHDFPGAHGMTLVNENGEEFLFLTDYARHQVFKTTLDGRVLLTLDAPFESGRFIHADQYKPTHVISAPDGSFYVLDGYGTSLVLHYDAQGKLLHLFGGRGKTPESINEAHGGAIDPRSPARPTLLITSRQDGSIKRFGLDGAYLGEITLPNTLPCDVVFAGRRHLCAAAPHDRRQEHRFPDDPRPARQSRFQSRRRGGCLQRGRQAPAPPADFPVVQTPARSRGGRRR